MKKILLIFATLLCFSNIAFCHLSQEIPENVLKSFSRQYPQVNIQKWEVKHDTCIAKFTSSSKKKNLAFYLFDGNWIKTETKIRWSWLLPKAVEEGFNHSALASWYIDEIKQISSPGKIHYVMQVHNNLGPDDATDAWQDIYVLVFDENGRILRKDRKD